MLRIEDANFTLIADFFDIQRRLSPGQARSFSINYTPNTTGFHVIRVVVPFDGQTAERLGLFFVNPPQPVFIPGEVKGGGTITKERKPPKEYNMNLIYPRTLILLRGDTSVFHITVENTEDLPLTNITLEMPSDFILIEHSPALIKEIPPASKKTFVVTAAPKEGTEEGIYPTGFRVVSQEIERAGEIVFDVRILEDDKEIQQLIMNYMYLYLVIKHEMEEAEKTGYDTGKAWEYLEAARERIGNAVRELERKNKEGAKDMLKEAKELLIKAAIEVANVKVPVPVFILPAFLPYGIIIGLLIFFPFLFLFYEKRKRKKEEEELLKEPEKEE